MPQLSFHSPFGDLTLSQELSTIVSLDWGWSPTQSITPILAEAKRQLDAYFDGDAVQFDIPLNPAGTRFQHSLWYELTKIPFGATVTYGALAERVRSAPRAIGQACARNPIPILIPCHRVLAADGSLGGYSGAGGAETKRRLLELERAADRLRRRRG